MTRSCFFRRYPEGEEPPILQVKPETHWLIRQRRQIFNASPEDRMQRGVRGHWQAIPRRESRHNFAPLTQNFDAQLALRIVHVNEQMPARESHGPRGERAACFIRVYRSETVTSKRGQSRRQGPRLVAARSPASSADIEVEFVAHDQESTAGRLDVVRVPITLLVRYRTEHAPIRTGPMPSVAAVTQHNVVWLVTIRRLAPPDGEKSDHQPFAR